MPSNITGVKRSKMEFLEDLDMYDKAMTNAYFIITKRKSLDE